MRGNIRIKDREIRWMTTFPGSIGFKCEKCGYCCTATDVHISKQDIIRVGEKADKGFIEPSQTGFRIKGTKNNRCMFLNEENICKIYENRPFVCRQYPFKVIFVGDTAYIDTLFSCKSIIKNKNIIRKIKNKKSEKEKDFYEELIKNSSNEKFFDIKKELDEIESKLNKKRWKNNIHELRYVSDLLELYRAISPEEKIDFEFFVGKFFGLFKDQLKKESVYMVLDLDTDEFYSISADDDNILINNKKIIKLKNRKKFNRDSKDIIINYLENYLNRKTTVVDLYFAVEYLKKENKNIEIYELQREILKRILLLMEFFILIISEYNSHREITKKDALETIFAIDSTIFTPMGAILPGLGKGFFD